MAADQTVNIRPASGARHSMAAELRGYSAESSNMAHRHLREAPIMGVVEESAPGGPTGRMKKLVESS